MFTVNEQDGKGSPLNYLIASMLLSLRGSSPYFSFSKKDYFDKYEPKVKQDLSIANVAVLFDDNEFVNCANYFVIPRNKRIISWCAVIPPDEIIFCYTRNSERNKGHATKLFNILKAQLDFNKNLFLKYYNITGFRFFNKLGEKSEPPFKVFSR